jgi:hypothetical protein
MFTTTSSSNMFFIKAVLFASVVSSAYGIADLNWSIAYKETIPALNNTDGPRISLTFDVDTSSDSANFPRYFETALLSPDCLTALDASSGLSLAPIQVDDSTQPAVLTERVNIALASLAAPQYDTVAPDVVGGPQRGRIQFCLRLQVCPGTKTAGVACVPMNMKQVKQTTTFALTDDFQSVTYDTQLVDSAQGVNSTTTIDAQLRVYWCAADFSEVAAPTGPFNPNTGIYTFCVTSNSTSVVVQSIDMLTAKEVSNTTGGSAPVEEVLVNASTILTPYYTIVDCSKVNFCRIQTNVKFEFYTDAQQLLFEGQALLKVGVARKLRRLQEESKRIAQFTMQFDIEQPSGRSSATVSGVTATFLVPAAAVVLTFF